MQQLSVSGVEPGVLYPLPALKRLVGWESGSFRRARADGLPVLYRGRTAFVRGEDFIRFIEENSARERS